MVRNTHSPTVAAATGGFLGFFSLLLLGGQTYLMREQNLAVQQSLSLNRDQIALSEQQFARARRTQAFNFLYETALNPEFDSDAKESGDNPRRIPAANARVRTEAVMEVIAFARLQQDLVLRNAAFSGHIAMAPQLNGALMSDVNLLGMDLHGVEMTNADLRGAELSGANLSGALLLNANLSGAKLVGTNFRGADLSSARNLTPSQIALACGDDRTSVPPGLKSPPVCSESGDVR